MDVELERVTGAAVEAYHVRLSESDKSGNHVVLGIVERVSVEQWSFRPMHPIVRRKGEVPRFQTGPEVLLTARNVDELRDVIEQRFGSFDLPADRLRDETSARIAYEVLKSMLVLSRRTSSIGGFTKAVAQVMAHIVAEDLKPEHEQEYRAAFNGSIDSGVQAIREARRLSDAIAAQLAHMFKPNNVDDHDDEPTKH